MVGWVELRLEHVSPQHETPSAGTLACPGAPRPVSVAVAFNAVSTLERVAKDRPAPTAQVQYHTLQLHGVQVGR